MSDVQVGDLCRHPGFAKRDPPHRRRLVSLAHYANAEAGQMLMKEGDDSGDLYIVLSGRVALAIQVEGEPYVFSEIGPGELVGFSALLNQGQRVASAQALEPCRLVALSGAALRRLCAADLAVGYAVMRAAFETVAQRLVDSRQRLARG